MVLNWEGLSADHALALERISKQLNLTNDKNSEKLIAFEISAGLSVAHTENGWEIGCADLSAFVRAVSLVHQFEDKPVGFSIAETPKYNSLAAMIDCARNAVPTVDALKKMFVIMALMGFNSAQLYMEDVFELEGYPYFGYLRGRYSMEEMREIDEFAASVGIEVVPCIQTLAHMSYVLRWDAFQDIHDCNGILLAGEEKTYALIDAMFNTVSKAFKSRRINLGMDEAHALGLGRYMDLHGYQNRTDIMIDHLNRVMELAKKYDYSPMIWSDMFFRLANGGEYYVSDKPFDREVIKKIPEGLGLIYWDYYSEDPDFYVNMIKRHQEFNRPVVFAGGAWKWHSYTPQNEMSMKYGEMAANACEQCGVKDALLTCWGDNGSETSMFAVLPTFMYWAERSWADDNEEWRKQRFEACCGCAYDDFMLLDKPAYEPGNPAPGKNYVSPTKNYLYQDILLGLADYRDLNQPISDHFAKCAAELQSAAGRCPQFEPILNAQARLCEVLEVKATVGCDLRKAYAEGKRDEMRRIGDEVLPEISKRIKKFHKAYLVQWNAENKPFASECFDIKIGALLQRMESVSDRIRAYLNGDTDSIPELEQKILPPSVSAPDELCPFIIWERIASPNLIANV